MFTSYSPGMPAPNCGSSPDNSESNMNLSDEDGEDLPSKTSATHHLTLKRGHVRETTAPPRTKKKMSDSVEEENIFDRASCSPPKDSTSDPPVKKAKLLNTSSASYGEALSQKANSKVSLKRAASTDSEDEMSNDGSKTDIFRERDDGDKARCIRQYSNRVKAKRKAEELPSAPQETNQDLSAAPTDTVQMDHDYGRASDTVSTQSLDYGNLDQKETNNQFVNQESSVHSTQSESNEILASVAESLKTGTEVQCASDKTQYNPNSIGNDTPSITFHGEISDSAAFPENDCVTFAVTTNDIDNVAESIKSQKDNEIQILLSGTCNSSTTESNPGCREEPQEGERAASDHTGQTSVYSGTANKDANKTSADQSEETITLSVVDLESQTDHSAKEELKSKTLQHHVSQDVPDTTTDCDSENNLVYNTEESERKDIWSSSAPILAVPGSVVDVMDTRTDSTSEDVEAVVEQNQTEIDSAREPKMDMNSQPDSAQKEDLQIDKSYECTGHAAEVTEEVAHEQASTPGTQIEMDVKASGTSGQNGSNGAATVETEIITGSNEYSVINSTVEHQDSVNLENSSGQNSLVTAVTESFIPECTLEGQSQNRGETDEPDIEAFTENMLESSNPDVNDYATDRCEEEHHLPVVCQSNEDRETAEEDMQAGTDDISYHISNAGATPETQELTQPPKVQALEDHGRENLAPTEYGSPTKIQPEIDFQTLVDSEEICSPTEVSEVTVQKEFTVTTHECEEDKDTRMADCESSAGIQEKDQVEAAQEVVSGIQTHKSIGVNIEQDQEEDIDGAVTTGEPVFEPVPTVNFQSCENLVVNNPDMESGGDVMSECCKGKKEKVEDPQLQMDIDTSSTAGETSVASSTAEVESHQSHDVTNLDIEVQENPVNERFEMKYTTADSPRKIGTIGTTEEGETSYQQSTVNAQISDNLEISDLSTGVQQDFVSESEESKTDDDKMTGEECDSVSETHMETAAAEAERVSDSPHMEAKNHESTKISDVDARVYQDLGSKGDEDKPKTECADMSEIMMSKPEEMQSCTSMEMTEIHTEEEKVSESHSAKVDENVLAAAYISIPEPQMSTGDSETPEEITTTVDEEDHRCLETSEVDESLQNNAVKESGKIDADCIHVPEDQTSAPPEETLNPSLAEIQSPGQVEMLELDKDDEEDQDECKVKENPTTEHVNDPESQTHMEATTSPEEIPYPPPTVQRLSSENVEIMGGSSEVSETTDNCIAESVVLPECNNMDATSTEPVQSDLESSQLSMEFTADPLTESCDSKVEEDALAAEHVNIPDPQRKTETTAAKEEILSELPTLDTGGEVRDLSTEVQNNVVSGSFETKLDEDSCTAESDDVPEAPVETPAAQEEISKVTSAVEQGCQETIFEPPNAPLFDINNSPAVAASENKENESGEKNMQVDEDAICGSKEGFDSALEEEDKMQVTQADQDPVIISTDQPDAEHKEGTEQREVMLLVFDSGDAGPPSEEQVQMIPQPQEEIQADQVVYEPISSPESSDDREVPAASHNHVGFSVLEMEETVVEGGSSAEGNTAVGVQVENNAEEQSQAPDSQEEEMRGNSSDVADSCVPPEAEQSVHVRQVAVISSSDDIRMHEDQPEGAVEGRENSSYPDDSSAAESSEVVQEIAEHQEATDITMRATAATTMFAIPDSTSEEYVILEPVPQSEINFDIVTQAAAESGLSVPFATQVNPGVTLEGDVTNGPQVMVFSEAEVPQSQASDATEALNHKIISPLECFVQNSDQQQASAETMDVDASEIDITNSDTQKTSQDCVAMDTNEENLGLQEVQILEDIEIGREVVLAEEDNEEDGDVSIVEKPQIKEAIPPEKSEMKSDEKDKEDSSDSKFKPNSTAEKVEGDKKEPEDVKPKKQQMNTQARTKARLAALAEQKAAAAKKSANRHQLNLLALCQEIAEDIETDSMLLKKIEEEKQAAAAAVADVLSKNEASEESPRANTPANTDTTHASAPVDPEASVTPTKEESPSQPSTADAAEAKPAEEPPKRRFFISQVTVPLKAHEKKKLTRYQRLRQVELQREKMSWARVKKLKSDQASQMFSDIDWQEPLNVFSQFSMNPIAKAPLPVASPAKTPLPCVASTSTSEVPNKDVPIVETPKNEPIKTEPIKTEPIKTEPIKTEPIITEATKTEPAETEEAKSNPVKTEAAKSVPPHTEVRRSARQTKAQASKETSSPGPSQKVTRSAAKKKLPAVPPPMPNGLSAQKQTPVEYKPYRPKPKYSFEDFELDDDPVPVATARPSPQPQQTRTNIQPFPTAQSKPVLPAQPSNQAMLKTRLPPAGQDSSPSRSAVATKPSPDTPAAAAGSSKAALSAKPQSKPSTLSTPQSTSASALGQSSPAAAPLLKPTSSGDAAHSGQSTATTASSTSAAAVRPTPEKTLNPPSAEGSSKVTTLLSCNT